MPMCLVYTFSCVCGGGVKRERKRERVCSWEREKERELRIYRNEWWEDGTSCPRLLTSHFYVPAKEPYMSAKELIYAYIFSLKNNASMLKFNFSGRSGWCEKKTETRKGNWIEVFYYLNALTHCNTLQHIATHCNAAWSTPCSTLQHTQHTATHCNTLQNTATHCNTLQHTATHCNTL